jgi:Flp pilus assembly protein TadD
MIIILVSACSSQGNRNLANSENEKLKDDYGWIDSLDFDKKTETKYNPNSDEVKTNKEDEKQVLVKESIASLSSPRLDEQLKESEDPLSKIAIKCYQGKTEEAFIEINKVYSQYKNNTSYWNQVGTCYYLMGDYSKAILFYNKSRDLDSKFIPPLNNLGVVYQKQGRFQKAFSAYKKASEVNAFAVTPAFNLARLYLQFGIVTKAEPILVSLYNKSHDDFQVANSLGTIYLIKKDYQNAVNVFANIPKDQLSKPEIALNYSIALKLLGKSDEAKAIYNQSAESSGELKQYSSQIETILRN